MNTNDIILRKRDLSKVGLDLYFYNVRTLMIYEYEILYQLTEGVWSSSRYPRDHSDVWINANLHITQGKSNARNVVETGCKIVKNNYDLKKILDIPTSYNRVKIIGKLCEATSDVDLLMSLFNEGFHEISYEFNEEFNETEYNNFMEFLVSNGYNKSASLFSEDLMESFINSIYNDNDMKDDLGMIQNTMRNTMSLYY